MMGFGSILPNRHAAGMKTKRRSIPFYRPIAKKCSENAAVNQNRTEIPDPILATALGRPTVRNAGSMKA
jgi:hypothetical protein